MFDSTVSHSSQGQWNVMLVEYFDTINSSTIFRHSWRGWNLGVCSLSHEFHHADSAWKVCTWSTTCVCELWGNSHWFLPEFVYRLISLMRQPLSSVEENALLFFHCRHVLYFRASIEDPLESPTAADTASSPPSTGSVSNATIIANDTPQTPGDIDWMPSYCSYRFIIHYASAYICFGIVLLR